MCCNLDMLGLSLMKQVDDLAAAMTWMAANMELLGVNVDDSHRPEPNERMESANVPTNVASTQESTQETFQPGGTNRHRNEDARITGESGRVDAVSAPQVYLMGHSSGAHICLLYLIRRAEEGNKSTSSASSQAGGVHVEEGRRARDSASAERELEVEGLIGLSGVYDIHSHYLYESWR